MSEGKKLSRGNEEKNNAEVVVKLLEAMGELPEEMIGEAADLAQIREERQEEIKALEEQCNQVKRTWHKWIPLGAAGVVAAALLFLVIGYYKIELREQDFLADFHTDYFVSENHYTQETEEQFGLHFYVTADADTLQAGMTSKEESRQKQLGENNIVAPDGETENEYADYYTQEDIGGEQDQTGSAQEEEEGLAGSAAEGETEMGILSEAVSGVEISDAFPIQSIIVGTGKERSLEFILAPGEDGEEEGYRFSVSKGIITENNQKSCQSGEPISFVIPFDQKLSDKEKVLLPGAWLEWDLEWMGKIQVYRGKRKAPMTTVYLGRQGEQLYIALQK